MINPRGNNCEQWSWFCSHYFPFPGPAKWKKNIPEGDSDFFFLRPWTPSIAIDAVFSSLLETENNEPITHQGRAGRWSWGGEGGGKKHKLFIRKKITLIKGSLQKKYNLWRRCLIDVYTGIYIYYTKRYDIYINGIVRGGKVLGRPFTPPTPEMTSLGLGNRPPPHWNCLHAPVRHTHTHTSLTHAHTHLPLSIQSWTQHPNKLAGLQQIWCTGLSGLPYMCYLCTVWSVWCGPVFNR